MGMEEKMDIGFGRWKTEGTHARAEGNMWKEGLEDIQGRSTIPGNFPQKSLNFGGRFTTPNATCHAFSLPNLYDFTTLK